LIFRESAGVAALLCSLAPTLPGQALGSLEPGARIEALLEVAPGARQYIASGAPIQTDVAGGLQPVRLGGLEIALTRSALDGESVLLVNVPGAVPARVALLPGQSSKIELPRNLGPMSSVPYLVHYNRSERNGETREGLAWEPVYRAEGVLVVGGCRRRMFVTDFNGDGVFDLSDGRAATTIGLDRNDDGRFSGRGDFLSVSEIFEVCGEPLLVAEIDPAGRSVVFTVSEIRPPAVGDAVPAFSLTDVDGNLLTSSELRGKTHVLDFWASWCAPCVNKLVAMERISKDRSETINVIGINVDKPERRAMAERILTEKGLSFRQVVRAQGEKDMLWKMFGSMEGVSLAIPLYVVIDAKGVIRYASDGGDELEELTAVLDGLGL
jgi:peroxiredoxin